MTQEEALKILRIQEVNSPEEIKKQYRRLMMRVHPDALSKEPVLVDARDLNLAYEFLIKHPYHKNLSSEKGGTIKKSSAVKWNAPINPAAYCDRDIYHQVEDMDGMIIGEAVIDTGKYYWTADEEFPLFLRSLYHCGKQIIQEYSEHNNRSDSAGNETGLLSEIVYLLSQQFVDSKMVLSEFSAVNEESDCYQVDAMLELSSTVKLRDGEPLYPMAMRKHRLYVSNRQEKEAGYLSFRDDRLYYGIIPLFERRAAKIKMQIQGNDIRKTNGKTYRNVILLIKLNPENRDGMIESINMKIDRLLEQYGAR